MSCDWPQPWLYIPGSWSLHTIILLIVTECTQHKTDRRMDRLVWFIHKTPPNLVWGGKDHAHLIHYTLITVSVLQKCKIKWFSKELYSLSHSLQHQRPYLSKWKYHELFKSFLFNSNISWSSSLFPLYNFALILKR